MVVRGAGHLGERALGRGGSPMERIQRKVRGEAAEYARAARAAVDEMAESELRALRRAIRRRRKQLGL